MMSGPTTRRIWESTRRMASAQGSVVFAPGRAKRRSIVARRGEPARSFFGDRGAVAVITGCHRTVSTVVDFKSAGDESPAQRIYLSSYTSVRDDVLRRCCDIAPIIATAPKWDVTEDLDVVVPQLWLFGLSVVF